MKHWLLVIDGQPNPAIGLWKTKARAAAYLKRNQKYFSDSASITIEKWESPQPLVWRKAQ